MANVNFKSRSSSAIIAALLVAAMFLSGCGGDTPAPAPSPTNNNSQPTAEVMQPTVASGNQPTVAVSADACLQAVAALESAKTMHFAYSEAQQGASAPGELGGDKQNTATGTYKASGDADLDANNWHYTANDSRPNRTDIMGEWLHIKTKTYHKTGSNWTTPEAADALPLTIKSRLSQLSSAMPSADKVKLLGIDTVESQSASHCQFTASGDAQSGDVTYDVWVNGSGALVQYKATRQSSTITFAISKLNEPVTIPTP